MNERIKELACEAEDYADSIVDQGGEFHPAYTKKFAELIVRECIAQCEKNVDHEYLGWGSKLSACNIKHHFGVKE